MLIARIAVHAQTAGPIKLLVPPGLRGGGREGRERSREGGEREEGRGREEEGRDGWLWKKGRCALVQILNEFQHSHVHCIVSSYTL